MGGRATLTISQLQQHPGVCSALRPTVVLLDHMPCCCCRWKVATDEDPALMEARLLEVIDYPVNVVKNMH